MALYKSVLTSTNFYLQVQNLVLLVADTVSNTRLQLKPGWKEIHLSLSLITRTVWFGAAAKCIAFVATRCVEKHGVVRTVAISLILSSHRTVCHEHRWYGLSWCCWLGSWKDIIVTSVSRCGTWPRAK